MWLKNTENKFCYKTCFQPNFAVSQKNFYELRINSNQPYTLRLTLKPQLNAASMIRTEMEYSHFGPLPPCVLPNAVSSRPVIL